MRVAVIMSETHALTETLKRLRAEQTRYLVAHVSGSSYRRPGARLIIAEIQAVLSGSTARPLSQCRGQIHRSRLVSLDSGVGAL